MALDVKKFVYLPGILAFFSLILIYFRWKLDEDSFFFILGLADRQHRPNKAGYTSVELSPPPPPQKLFYPWLVWQLGYSVFLKVIYFQLLSG